MGAEVGTPIRGCAANPFAHSRRLRPIPGRCLRERCRVCFAPPMPAIPGNKSAPRAARKSTKSNRWPSIQRSRDGLRGHLAPALEDCRRGQKLGEYQAGCDRRFRRVLDHRRPRKPNVVYASACSGIYKSANGGSMFKKIQGIPATARRTRVLQQDPVPPRHGVRRNHRRAVQNHGRRKDLPAHDRPRRDHQRRLH